jgi:hypothetical protein
VSAIQRKAPPCWAGLSNKEWLTAVVVLRLIMSSDGRRRHRAFAFAGKLSQLTALPDRLASNR